MENLIYHYTSMNVFLHLVESLDNNENFIFHASDVFYMNDPQEYIYGQKVLINVIKKIEESRNIPISERLSEYFVNSDAIDIDCICKCLSNVSHQDYNTPFVISFSKNKDSLPMWLNYGSNGSGVCLGFQLTKTNIQEVEIGTKTFTFQSAMDWKDVKYYSIDDKKKNGKDHGLYKMIERSYNHLYNDNNRKGMKVDEFKIQTLQNLFIDYCPYIKRIDYEYEQEVRIARKVRITSKDDLSNLNFRINSKGNVIPYINIEIPKEYLKLVKIGPLANHELTSSALKMIKEKYDLDYDLSQSCVKYRNY